MLRPKAVVARTTAVNMGVPVVLLAVKLDYFLTVQLDSPHYKPWGRPSRRARNAITIIYPEGRRTHSYTYRSPSLVMDTRGA